MKKYIILLAALAAAACVNKETPDQVGSDGMGVYDVSADGDENVVAGHDRQSLTFTADAAVTKTALADDWSVLWCEGDKVKILWKGGNAVSEARLESGKAFFSAVVEEVDEYYAVYPSSIDASVGQDGKLSFEVPSSQSGKFSDCAVIVAHTTRESLDFGRFRSAVGLIRFRVGDALLTRARFGAADDSAVCGSVSTDAAFSAFTPDATTASIDIDLDGSGVYYLAVPAGLTFPGLKFELGTAASWKGEAVNDKSATIAAGQILCVDASIDEELVVVGDIYINDSASLISLLSDPSSASKLDGHTVHIAEGNYNLGDAGLTLSYDSPITLTMEGEPGKTVITCGGESGILAVTAAGVNLNLKGLSFIGGKNSLTGGALNLRAGTHIISNCIFKDNETISTTTANNDKTGGAVYIGGSAAVDIEDCVFENNKTKITGGAAVAIYSTAKVTILGCSFKGNNPDKIGNGGAILQKHDKSVLYVVNCSFDGNSCATNGADIFSSKGTALMLYNCTGVNPINTSAGNLGFIRANCPALVANCSFAAQTVGEANGEFAFGVTGDNFVVNNLVICYNGNSFGTASTSTHRAVTSYGHNVFTRAPLIDWMHKGSAIDISGLIFEDIFPEGATLNASGVLEWSGPADLPNFVNATASGIETALKAYPKGGTDFYAWLVAKAVFDKDAAGTPRGDSWWPGAYQKAE